MPLVFGVLLAIIYQSDDIFLRVKDFFPVPKKYFIGMLVQNLVYILFFIFMVVKYYNFITSYKRCMTNIFYSLQKHKGAKHIDKHYMYETTCHIENNR